MEAVEFVKQKNRMCDYYSGRTCTHDDSGETCPAISIDCDITTNDLEQLVAIVERWAKEHPEETAAATTHKNDEPCVKTIQDGLEGAIYHAIASNKTQIEKLEYDVSVIRHNLAVLDDRIYARAKRLITRRRRSQAKLPSRSGRTRMCCLRRSRMPMYALTGFRWRARCRWINIMIAASL